MIDLTDASLLSYNQRKTYKNQNSNWKEDFLICSFRQKESIQKPYGCKARAVLIRSGDYPSVTLVGCKKMNVGRLVSMMAVKNFVSTLCCVMTNHYMVIF